MEVYLQSCSFLVDDIRRKPYSEMKRSKIELPHGNASGQFGESQTVRKSEAFSKWLGRSPCKKRSRIELSHGVIIVDSSWPGLGRSELSLKFV